MLLLQAGPLRAGAREPAADSAPITILELPTPGSPEWQPVLFAKIERHTRYEVVPLRLDPGAEPQPVFHARADCSASGMLLPLETIDLERTPVLRWWWNLTQGLEIEDEQSKAGDDFGARVYLLFRFEADRASFGERLAQRLASSLARRELPGNVLSYVWTSRTPAGQSWPNPYAARTHMRALRSGTGGRGSAPAAGEPAPASGAGGHWEAVDLLADQRRLAGVQAGTRLMALALMSDTDNSCQQAEAFFGGFRFTSRDALASVPQAPPSRSVAEPRPGAR